jgi:hypothetical protein
MNASSSEPWTPSLALRIDQVCLAFETAWQRGDRPRLEEYMAQLPAPDHVPLFVELFALELCFRRAAGQKPTPADYLRRFPAFAQRIVEAFDQEDAPLPPPPLDAVTRDENLPVDGVTFPPCPVPGTPTSEITHPEAVTLTECESSFPAIPGYEILARLGEGGMGVVYRARHLRLNRLVALKMLRGGGLRSSEDAARLVAEAVARLQHPNIVQIHEVGEWQGELYLALEFVGGGSLAHKLPQSSLPNRDAAELVRTLALAIHEAHARGIVHRDLKPANVLQTLDGVPKIADFGLAKRLDVDVGQTRTGAVVGTPSYMAPEQALGQSRQVTPLTDVYALGAILYETLTGRPPFLGASILDTLHQVVNDEPVPPRHLQPQVQPDLETISLKCLQKAPAQRYDSALALADDLGRFLAGQPIRARPASLGERGWKWVRRRPALAALLGVSALSVATLLGVLLWFTAALRTERDNLRQQRDLAGANRRALQEQRARAVAEKESMLLHERVDALRAEQNGRLDEFYAGRGQLTLLLQSTRALREAKFQLADTTVERADIADSTHNFLQHIERESRERFQAGRLPLPEMAQITTARLEAQITLMQRLALVTKDEWERSKWETLRDLDVDKEDLWQVYHRKATDGEEQGRQLKEYMQALHSEKEARARTLQKSPLEIENAFRLLDVVRALKEEELRVKDVPHPQRVTVLEHWWRTVRDVEQVYERQRQTGGIGPVDLAPITAARLEAEIELSQARDDRSDAGETASRLAALGRDRLRVLREQKETGLKELFAGQGSLSLLLHALKGVEEAELQQSTDPERQVVILNQAVETWRLVERVQKARYDAGRIPIQAMAGAKAGRAEAELRLLAARAINVDR